jgi:hypothetical protein
MQDESAIGWDPTTIYPAPSMALNVYVLFSLVAILAATVRLVMLWIPAPPFRLSKQKNNPAYLQQLSAGSHSLTQWMGCALLAGGFVASTDFYQTCNYLLRAKLLNGTLVLFLVRNSIPDLTLTLLVALVLYLARWHLLNRSQRLRELTTSATQ